MIPEWLTGIEFTRWMNGILNDAPDFIESFMLFISSPVFYLIIPIVIAIFVLWFVDKRFGEFLLTSFLLSSSLRELIKVAVKQPRPWIIDPSIQPSGNAIDGATGYSFPSGHASSSTAGYLGLALFRPSGIVIAACVSIVVLVCLSRLFLGVHTPLDVISGVLLSIAVMVFNGIALNRSYRDATSRIVYHAVFIVVSVAISIAVIASSDRSFNMLLYTGVLLGSAIGRPLEERFVEYAIPVIENKARCLLLIPGLAAMGIIALLGMKVIGGFAAGFICGLWLFLLYPLVMKRFLRAAS